MSLIDDIIEVEGEQAHRMDDPRWLLMRVHKAAREEARVRLVKATVMATYDQRLSVLGSQVEAARQQLRDWLVHQNGGQGVSFPDAGRATLRKVAAAVKVTDRTLAERVAVELGCVNEVADLSAATVRVRETMEGTGEIPPGFEFVEEHETLVVGS